METGWTHYRQDLSVIPENSVEKNEINDEKIIDDFDFNQDNSIEFDGNIGSGVG